MEMLEHLVGVDVQHIKTLPARSMGEGLSEMAFAYARWPADQHVTFLADVLTAGQVEHLLAVDGGVKAPIEALQRFSGIEGSPPHPQRELLLGPAFDLIFEQAFEKLDVGPLPLDGLPVAGSSVASTPERRSCFNFEVNWWFSSMRHLPRDHPGALRRSGQTLRPVRER